MLLLSYEPVLPAVARFSDSGVCCCIFRIHCKFWCLQLLTLDPGKTRHVLVVPVLSGDRLWMCHHWEELIRSISFIKLDFYKDKWERGLWQVGKRNSMAGSVKTKICFCVAAETFGVYCSMCGLICKHFCYVHELYTVSTWHHLSPKPHFFLLLETVI
jgi:hypothetical protein